MDSKDEQKLPTPELLAELEQLSNSFEQSEPEAILAWALEKYHDKFTMATAFGPEGLVILEMPSRIDSKCHVFNLDTGYQFPETLRLRDQVAEL